MLTVLQLKANLTANFQYQASHERLLFTFSSMGLSCAFLYINSILLFTLRSKPVFCETSRFILLYNLLFADTAHLVSNALLFIQASLRLKVPFSACGALVTLSEITAPISPLTLGVMSLERFVAVCYPLRHATIFTVRSTGMAILLVWVFSCIHILVRFCLLLYFLSEISVQLHLNDFCSKEAFFFAAMFTDFEKVYASTLFFSVGIAILASYVGVALVARSVSTNRASAKKALQTLLLHTIQLSMILVSTLFSTIMESIIRTVDRLALVRTYNLCFVCLSILPRCLSTLIYGLRDQTIRPIFMRNLCFRCRCPVVLRKRQ